MVVGMTHSYGNKGAGKKDQKGNSIGDQEKEVLQVNFEDIGALKGIGGKQRGTKGEW